MFKLIVFGIVSGGLVFLSRASLRDPRSHGFFRFSAFEAVLALILLNLEYWFSNPLSVFQILSWLLLLSSIFLAVHGFYMLNAIGRPEGRIENTTILVKRGAYKYIRHPLYGSLLLLAWGAFFKHPSFPGGVIALAASTFLVATAKVEEAENLRRFGAGYAEYLQATKMFIPFIF